MYLRWFPQIHRSHLSYGHWHTYRFHACIRLIDFNVSHIIQTHILVHKITHPHKVTQFYASADWTCQLAPNSDCNCERKRYADNGFWIQNISLKLKWCYGKIIWLFVGWLVTNDIWSNSFADKCFPRWSFSHCLYSKHLKLIYLFFNLYIT